MITILIISLAVWYVLFGFECVMLGATLGYKGKPWLLPFAELWKDLTQGDPSGLIHSFIMHFCIPFGPAIIYHFL